MASRSVHALCSTLWLAQHWWTPSSSSMSNARSDSDRLHSVADILGRFTRRSVKFGAKGLGAKHSRNNERRGGTGR